MRPVDELAVCRDGKECRDHRLLPVLFEEIHGFIDRVLDPLMDQSVLGLADGGQRRDAPTLLQERSAADALGRAAGAAAVHQPIVDAGNDNFADALVQLVAGALETDRQAAQREIVAADLGLELLPGSVSLVFVRLVASPIKGEGGLKENLRRELVDPLPLDEPLEAESGFQKSAPIEKIRAEQIGRVGAGLGVQVFQSDFREYGRVALLLSFLETLVCLRAVH